MTDPFLAALHATLKSNGWPNVSALSVAELEQTKPVSFEPGGTNADLVALLLELDRTRVNALPATSPHRLAVLRHVAIRCSQWPSGSADEKGCRAAAELCQVWLWYLLGDEVTARHMYLSDYRAQDVTYYDAGTLVPVVPKERTPASPTALLPWWLRHPERLSILELELCLILFDRNSKAEKVAPWLLRKPGLLRHVQATLLKRYCFTLLGALRRAKRQDKVLKKTHLLAPAFVWAPPRIFGLAAVGYLATVTSDIIPAVLYGASLVWIFGVIFFGSVVTAFFLYFNVHKHNLGAFGTWRHARFRIARLFITWAGCSALEGLLLILTWVVAAGVAADGFVRFESSPLSNLVIPRFGSFTASSIDIGYTGDRLVRFLALVFTANVIGGLLQWFWDDRSALEPL